MPTPRLRSDLEAHAAEEGGLRFFDVHDPRSGASMRLYEHEWLIARHMDGSATLGEISRWAGEHVGFYPSAADLAEYARRLGELGFFDEPVSLSDMTASEEAAEPMELSRPKAAAADETDFAELDDDASQTADVRPEVIAAVRSAEILSTVQKVQAQREQANGSPPPIYRAEPEPAPRPSAPPPALPTVSVAPSGTPATVRAVTAPPSTTVTPPPPAKRSRGGLLTAVIMGVVVAAGAAAYYGFVALAPVHVKVQAVGAAKDVFNYFEGTGTVSRTPPQTLSFGDAGKVIDVASPGVETKPGMTLASLDTYATMEKELADVRDRESFYEDALKKAQSHHKASDIKKALSKIDEKKRRQQFLEDKIAKARIIATSTATVSEVLVTPGTAVAAGAPVIKLADKRTLVEAKLAAADAKQMKAGQVVSIAPAGGSALGQAKVTAVDGETVKLEVTDDAAGAIKPGEPVRLVRQRIQQVMRVPAAAVSKTQGGAEQVFVLVNGVVKARPVTVADRTPADVYVSAGISPDDRVVVSAPPDLADGQKAVAE